MALTMYASWLLLTQFLVTLVLTTAGKVPAVIVFGDSSVDAGNNNQISTILKSNFVPYGRDFVGGKPTGRFSNGRIPPDFISQAFGLKPTVPAYLDPNYSIKDFATGVCFASAGTGYDNATSDVLVSFSGFQIFYCPVVGLVVQSVIPLWGELEYYKDYQKKLRAYLGTQKANNVISEALYLMSLGTNDFLENYYILTRRSSQYSIKQYQDFLGGIAEEFIRQLYSLGARKISLGGLPPMGCLPLERTMNFFTGRQCRDEYNNVAKEFNGKLKGLVVRLNKELKGIKLVLSNPYDILLQIIQRPSSYGFEVTGMACCATGMIEMSYMCDRFNPFTCTDASKYVFWDSFHPTEKTNRIISAYVMKHALGVFL
ncbi:GDSL lipase/esterase [Dillenia turbinata]|uniref:GDSL lipase/esterase n=1 Tax=Dillenia turbinata TaxID=194707 RepID=A0AAN8V0J6_9MAGN